MIQIQKRYSKHSESNQVFRSSGEVFEVFTVGVFKESSDLLETKSEVVLGVAKLSRVKLLYRDEE